MGFRYNGVPNAKERGIPALLEKWDKAKQICPWFYVLTCFRRKSALGKFNRAKLKRIVSMAEGADAVVGRMSRWPRRVGYARFVMLH